MPAVIKLRIFIQFLEKQVIIVSGLQAACLSLIASTYMVLWGQGNRVQYCASDYGI